MRLKSVVLMLALAGCSGCASRGSTGDLIEQPAEDARWGLVDYQQIVGRLGILGYVKTYRNSKSDLLEYRILDANKVERGRVLSDGGTYKYNFDTGKLDYIGDKSPIGAFRSILDVAEEFNVEPYVREEDSHN